LPETNTLCVAVNYIALALDAFNAVKDTPVVTYADEFVERFMGLGGD
jgi:hypothetical protein